MEYVPICEFIIYICVCVNFYFICLVAKKIVIWNFFNSFEFFEWQYKLRILFPVKKKKEKKKRRKILLWRFIRLSFSMK
jgi:hypothetical protein